MVKGGGACVRVSVVCNESCLLAFLGNRVGGERGGRFFGRLEISGTLGLISVAKMLGSGLGFGYGDDEAFTDAREDYWGVVV